MFEEDIARESIGHLVGENLLVHSPSEWLSDLVLEVSDASDRRILRVVRVHDAYEVIFGECLEVVQKVLNHLIVSLLVGGKTGEQTRKTVDDDQSKVDLQLFSLKLGQDHGKEHEKPLQVEHLHDFEPRESLLNLLGLSASTSILDEILHNRVNLSIIFDILIESL